MEVLIVEDSPIYSRSVQELVAKNGHQTYVAETIAEANKVLDREAIDLVVLDLVLPDGDGIDFCISLRARSSAFVIMLTSRDEEIDRVTGLRVGADDYVSKPFSPRELEARIQAVARRVNATEVKGQEPVQSSSHGPVSIDRGARTCTIDGVEVELTKVEFDLLSLLLDRPAQVLTRTQILDEVWGYDYYGDDHILDVHIANLRRKLRTQNVDKFIRTVRGVGYGLEAEVG